MLMRFPHFARAFNGFSDLLGEFADFFSGPRIFREIFQKKSTSSDDGNVAECNNNEGTVEQRGNGDAKELDE